MLTNLMAYDYGIILSRLVYQTDDKEVHKMGLNSFLSRIPQFHNLVLIPLQHRVRALQSESTILFWKQISPLHL